MAVTRDDVLRMAALARIGVPEARVDELVRELSAILDHMEELRRVAEVAEPRAEGPMPLAADEPGAAPLARHREEFAPATREGFFLVPRLHTHGDDAQGAS
jgi:aspartyl-tRNA(Asn)/glutamyl-tRNA(Gln) amidotransferase subunit C